MNKQDTEAKNLIRLKLLDNASTGIFAGSVLVGGLLSFYSPVIFAAIAGVGALSLSAMRRYISHNKEKFMQKLIRLHDQDSIDDDKFKELRRIISSLGKVGSAK